MMNERIFIHEIKAHFKF